MTHILVQNNNSILTTKRAAIGLLFLLLTTFVAYHPALTNGYIWDDDRYVSENPNLKDLEGLKDIWIIPKSSPQYYPLTFTTFWVEYHIWGLRPFGYHFNNILLHSLNAFLIWIILLCLKVPGAVLAAAIFAIHPVHVESVAWITERKNVLSGFFYLMALFCYLRFTISIPFEAGSTPQEHKTSRANVAWPYYAACIIFFVFALLSKTITATLPAVILLILWWQNGSIKKRDVLWLMPFFILGAGSGLITAWLEASYVGASGQEFAFSFWERCLVAGRALWFYIGKLAWPKDLMFIYPRWEIDVSQWWQYLFPVSFVALLICLYVTRGSIGRGPLVAVLIFAGTLFPAIGFLNVFPHRFSFVADHFQYLGSIAIIAAIAAIVAYIGKRYFSSPKKMRIFSLIVVLLMLNFGLKTAYLSFSYKNVITLWSDTIDRNKECWVAYNNLAAEYNKRKQYEKALPFALSAVLIKPDYDIGHVSLANAYYYLKDYDNAMVNYKKAIELFINKKNSNPYALYQFQKLGPTCFEALGAISLFRKEYDLSLAYFSKAIALNSDYPSVNKTVGKIYSMKGNNAEAVNHFRKALLKMELDPGLHYEIGIALLKLDKIDLSIVHFKRAIEIAPNFQVAIEKLADAERKLSEKSNTFDANTQY